MLLLLVTVLEDFEVSVFSHAFGTLYLEKGGAETEIRIGDHLWITEIHAGKPQEAVRIERNKNPLWFFHNNEWITSWSVGDIDAPDLFLFDLLHELGLDMVPYDDGWTVIKQA